MRNTASLKNLSPKQRAFAELIAQGYSRVEAYREVYAPQSKSNTAKQNGSRAAGSIPVAIEVTRREESLLPIGKAADEISWCLRNLKGLAADAKDERVRLMATLKLHEIWASRLDREKQTQAGGTERAAVLSDLQALYRKALEPIVEAVPAESEPAAAGVPGARESEESEV